MTHHIVKSWTYLFDAIASGKKTHDIRDMTERDYKVGDTMGLRRYDMGKGEYTGEKATVLITYITDNKTPCAFSSAVLDKKFGILSVKLLDKYTFPSQADIEKYENGIHAIWKNE